MRNRRKERLLNKCKHLLRRIGCPRWLHHFGPKTYKFIEHFRALIIRAYCKLSFVRTKEFCDLLGIVCPSKSALHYTTKKIKSTFWEKLLKETSNKPHIVAIDSTGLSRTNPSYHYLKRIDDKMPKVPIKLSVLQDTKTKKYCAAKIRVLPAHDVRDAKILFRKTKFNISVGDKSYNTEELYKLADEKGFILMSPRKKNVKRGFYRKKMQKHFRTKTYNRRQIVEAGFSSLKRKYGASVSSKKARTIRTEIYARLVCHNITAYIRDF